VSFPKTKPPHNIRVLHGWLRAYAAEHGQAEGRLKRSVDHAIVLNALHGVRDAAGKSMFVVKGGVAMELRLHLDARATRDLDAVFLGGFEEWLDALDDAFEESVAGFELSRGEPVEIRTTRTMRVDVYLDYRLGLGARHQVAVEVERHRYRGVAHERRQGLRVDAGGDHEGGVGVAGLVEP
jgi:hypothetical protein